MAEYLLAFRYSILVGNCPKDVATSLLEKILPPIVVIILPNMMNGDSITV